MNLILLLLDPTGRIGERTFWTALSLVAAAGGVAALVPFFGPLLLLAPLWPLGCVLTKRLHDADRRAWAVPPVVLLCAAAGMLSFTVTLMTIDPDEVIAAFGLAELAMLAEGIGLAVLLLLVAATGIGRGSAGANRFGEPEADALTFATLLRAAWP